MKIPFIDFHSQYQRIKPGLFRRMEKIFEKGDFILGEEVAEFETKLAAFAGAKFCIGCSNGTDALILALMAWGIGPGDAVLTSPFTFIATAEAAAMLGATPVFVDIDPKTWNIDTTKIPQKIDQIKKSGKLRLKAIIAVDLFGLPADYDALRSIAKQNGLFLLDDAAQSFGGRYKGRQVGSLADMTATSFFPSKPLGGYGDGGAILTDNPDWAAQLKSLRVHGQGKSKYENVRLGLNARLDTLQAAVLLEKLAILPSELEARQRLAARYSAGLKDAVKTPLIPDSYQSAWAQYSVLCPRRDELQAALHEKGIPTAVYYPTPLHLQPVFSGLGYRKGDFPVAESTAANIFSLPMHPYLSDAQADDIIANVNLACQTAK